MAKKEKGNSRVTVYPDWCKGCGICVEFCPGKVLEMSSQGKSMVVREEDCIRCGFCELHCPDFAIVVRDKEPDVAERCGTEQATGKAKGKGA
ncbi:4Fe-4S dicluster domain-containing protein [Pseudodesulfovibrio cashew]|uniref:4Fe-4S dicluster domain-containing protein n=1 Tax=Pseudodesulfovibrio cashew TaxID=2678688 RepID=A0A6I6JFB4_9BACT|nr:4Fe-4S binding protein [Pseudodesulfovibrio cashew]QGY41526.1 4Fe-4S dicluster domain-containing protein [Pseudodesulfovibrio cashew]